MNKTNVNIMIRNHYYIILFFFFVPFVLFGQPKEAKEAFEAAKVLYYAKDYQGAIGQSYKAIDLSKKESKTYFLAYQLSIWCYEELGDVQNVLRDYSILDLAGSKNPGKKASEYYSRARNYYDIKNYTLALEYFNKAIKEEKGRVYHKPILGRAHTNFALENYEDAIRDYSINIKLDFSKGIGLYHRALTYRKLDKNDLALNDLNKLIAFSPDNIKYLEVRSSAHLFLENYDESIEDANKVLDSVPENFEALRNRGLCYIKLGQYKNAIENYNTQIHINESFYNTQIDVNETFAQYYSHRGWCYFKTKEYLIALKDYKKSQYYYKDKIRVEYSIGVVAFELERYSESIEHLNYHIEFIKGKNKVPYIGHGRRGMAFFKLGKYEKAKTDLEIALSKDSVYYSSILASNEKYGAELYEGSDYGNEYHLYKEYYEKVKRDIEYAFLKEQYKKAQYAESLSISSTQPTSPFNFEELKKPYHALIIGNNDYQDPNLTDLDQPINDASKLYNVLTKNYTFDPDNVIFLKDATREDIIRALDSLSNTLTPNDNFIIFYAGHGHWNSDKETGYWLPIDAERDVTVDWVRNSTIQSYIEDIKAKHTLLIADACFGGGIFKSRAAFEEADMSIKNLYRYESRKAMTSGMLNEVPDKSVFMENLLERLNNNEEKFISSESLFFQFKKNVMNNSNNTPQFGTIYDTGDKGGDFIFILRDK